MTRDETLQVLAMLRAGCPQAYLNLSAEDAQAMVTVWSEMFLDTPVQLVTAAVKTVLWNDKTGRFPAIGAIREEIDNIEKVIGQCAYGSTLQEFMGDIARRYPPAVQAFIDSAYRARHKELYGREFTSQAQKMIAHMARLNEGRSIE